jgi:hypothetical protein
MSEDLIHSSLFKMWEEVADFLVVFHGIKE